MAKWRALAEYSPFARALVDFMWTERPPLVPNQFADRFGVRKQALSTWLNSAAVPAPQVVVRLARGMGVPVRDLLTAAGYASTADPLLDVVDAWAYVVAVVEQSATAEAEGGELDASAETVLTVLRRLQERAVAAAAASTRAAAGQPEEPPLAASP